MRLSKGGKALKALSFIFLILGALIILFPFYVVIITSLKTQQESAASFFSLPSSFYLGNFVSVFQKAGYLTYFKNSLIVTVSSVFCIFILDPMCAYAISRNFHKPYFKTVYYLVLIGIFVPFQVVMIPMVKYMGTLHLTNQFGLIIMHVTFASTQAIFLLTNYIRSVPPDLEEAAAIDGCSTFTAYWRVVQPLIKPMTVTIIVLNALWVWNDFQMPLIILNKDASTWTLPLFQYNFKSQYTYDYNMAFASYLVAMVPVMIAYVFGQKYIVAGLTQGAVKS